jgi:hypothetical protein
MPDAKLTALPIGTPARNALLYVVTNPSGSPKQQCAAGAFARRGAGRVMVLSPP